MPSNDKTNQAKGVCTSCTEGQTNIRMHNKEKLKSQAPRNKGQKIWTANHWAIRVL